MANQEPDAFDGTWTDFTVGPFITKRDIGDIFAVKVTEAAPESLMDPVPIGARKLFNLFFG